VRWRGDPAIGGARTLERPLDATTHRLADAGITIGPRTLVPWDGTPFHLGYVIDVRYRSPGTSAPTR
jgi:hypothetical protein